MPTCVHMYMCNRRRHFPCDPCNKLKKPGPRVGNAYFIIEQAVSAAYKQLYFRHLPSLLIWHECRKSNKQTVLKFRSYSATKNCKCLLLQNIWQPCNLFLCWHFRLYVCVFVRVVLPLVQNFFNAQLTNLKHLTKVRAIKVLPTKKKIYSIVSPKCTFPQSGNLAQVTLIYLESANAHECIVALSFTVALSLTH